MFRQSSHVSNVDPGLNLIQMVAGAILCPHQPLELWSRGGLIPAVCPPRARQAVEASGHVWALHLFFLQSVKQKYHISMFSQSLFWQHWLFNYIWTTQSADKTSNTLLSDGALIIWAPVQLHLADLFTSVDSENWHSRLVNISFHFLQASLTCAFTIYTLGFGEIYTMHTVYISIHLGSGVIPLRAGDVQVLCMYC